MLLSSIFVEFLLIFSQSKESKERWYIFIDLLLWHVHRLISMHTGDTISPSNNLLFPSFLVGGVFFGKARVNVMSEDRKGAEDISIQNT